ncbi:MAG: hypothetical protein ACREI7_11910, partial [Myxococcota bacterium]
MTTRWKKPGTAIAAAAWVAVCAYLYLAWPSLAALLETLVPPGGEPLVRIPRAAFPVLALIAVFGLVLKDRWFRAPLALVVDAVVGAPALL